MVDRSNSIVALRRFVAPHGETHRCDFCSLGLAEGHRHLLEMTARKLVCVCDPCALRFQNVTDGRFKLIPREVYELRDLPITEAEWNELALPISLAFFYRSSITGRTAALCPSPAGATESLVPLPAVENLIAEHFAFANMPSDVEALLINRLGANHRYFRTPIDVCFELVGLIRKHWRGLSGGELVWSEIDSFFGKLQRMSLPQASAPVYA